MMDTDVAVAGAGISGLSAAHFLVRRGLRVRLLEARKRAGGSMGSDEMDGFLVETGPNTVLETYPVLPQLCDELGISHRRVYASAAARARYIVRNGALHALPTGPLALLRTDLFSRRAKLRLLAEPFVRPAPAHAEETLEQFVTRRFGREFLEYAIDAFVAGVYAGVPERLGVRDAFPRLHRLEARYGSVLKGAVLGRRERRRAGRGAAPDARMFSFDGGLQVLVNSLVQELGPAFQPETLLEAVQPLPRGYELQVTTPRGERTLTCRALLLALPLQAYDQVQMPEDFRPAATALSRIPCPPVTMVFFGYRRRPAGRPLDGFGFLVPAREHRRILGTLFSSTLFPRRAPAGGAALTTFVGGARQPELALRDDGELVDLVRADLHELLGIQVPPDTVVIRRWERAIPQYQVGHRKIVERIEEYERTHPGLIVGGSFRRGISVADCIEQGRQRAERLAEALHVGGGGSWVS